MLRVTATQQQSEDELFQQRRRAAIGLLLTGAFVGCFDWIPGWGHSPPLRAGIAALDGVLMLAFVPVALRGYISLTTNFICGVVFVSFSLHFALSGSTIHLWPLVLIPIMVTFFCDGYSGAIWLIVVVLTGGLLVLLVHFEVWEPVYQGVYQRGVFREGLLFLAFLVIAASPVIWVGHSAEMARQREREAERQLRLREQRLAESAKFQSLAEMSGSVAHDFNNLLTVIGVYADMLDESEISEGIIRAQQQAAELTNTLLSFSRRRVDESECVDVNQMLRRLQPVIRGLLPPEVSLVQSLTTDATVVFVDRGQLEQSLINLVTNARDAIDGSGRVVVESKIVQGKDAVDDGSDGYVAVVVRDTGCGMSEEVKKRAVEPFFTTKDRGRGTGLGLATVYGLAHQSGGELTIRSRPTEGTSVQLTMRRIRASDLTASTDSPVDLAESRGDGQRIAVVEDRRLVRDVLQKSLQASNYDVIVAVDGVDALEKLEDVEFDLLVTDVIMPRLNGPDLVKELRRKRGDLPVIFISGYTDGLVQFSAEESSFTQFLAKPFAPSDLLQRIRFLLDDSRVA